MNTKYFFFLHINVFSSSNLLQVKIKITLTTFRYITKLFLSFIIHIDVTPWLRLSTTRITTVVVTSSKFQMIRNLKVELIYPVLTRMIKFTYLNWSLVRLSSSPITIFIYKNKWLLHIFFLKFNPVIYSCTRRPRS